MDEFEDDSGIIFRDTTLLALAAFVAMVIMLLPFVNPAVEAEAKPTAAGPVDVMIEITWNPEMDADVDLWVRAPGDLPVGYSNKGTALVNLLRDDLGHYSDLTNMNYEVSYSRGLIEGEWVVNLHCFRVDPDRLPPIRVHAAISIKRADDVRPIPVIGREVELNRVGQELTVVRFQLDKKGNVVEGSVNNLQLPMVMEAMEAGG